MMYSQLASRLCGRTSQEVRGLKLYALKDYKRLKGRTSQEVRGLK